MTAGNISIIIALAALLTCSAFFSASETAFSSMNHVRLKSMAAAGNKKAQRALALAAQYDKLLSTVLIGNNIVNITSSSLATVLFVFYFGNLGVTLSTVVMTVLVLIFGEISPKTLAKETPERFAMAVAPFLKGLMVVITPLNLLFSAWKKLILKLFRIDGTPAPATEEELLTYVEEVRQGGAIGEDEEEMLRSVIEFDDLHAIDVATPRVDIQAVDMDATPQEITALFHESGFSRLPVYQHTIDNIKGVLLEKDFHYFVQSLGQPLESVIRPILFITKSIKISKLLTELQLKKTHMAAIIDEYGGTLGIVTIEDIIEELVGEIWDEHDQVRQDIQPLADGRYRILGGTDLDEMLNLFGIHSDSGSQTAAGWAIEQLGHIPATGEHFTANGLHIQVSDVKRNRILSLVVSNSTPSSAKGSAEAPSPT